MYWVPIFPKNKTQWNRKKMRKIIVDNSIWYSSLDNLAFFKIIILKAAMKKLKISQSVTLEML